jgi:hypothetical protein
LNPLGFVAPAIAIGLGAISIKPQRGLYPVQTPNQVGPPPPPITPQVTIEELHRDELVITNHPVERGAAISDHAFKQPVEVIIRAAWSNSPSSSGGIFGQAVGVAAALLNQPLVGLISAIPQTVAAAGNTLQAAQSMFTGNAVGQVLDVYKKLQDLQSSLTPFTVYTGKRKYDNMLMQALTVLTNVDSENSLMVTVHCKEVIIVDTSLTTLPINPAALTNPAANTPLTSAGKVSPKVVTGVVPPATQ